MSAPTPLADLDVFETFPRTSDGWSLHLKRTRSPEHHDPRRPPILIVPGYGMNAFIFGFHPEGRHLERCLAEEGFEVWSVNLRGQGRSRAMESGARRASVRTLVDIDMPAAIAGALRNSASEASHVDLIGCSLGGTLAYAHLAREPDTAVRRVVTIGSPLRWGHVPVYFRMVFRSPELAGAVPIKGVRWAAKRVAPLARLVPQALSLYANPAHLDLSRLAEMAETVEDPSPLVNRDMARWFRDGDLRIGGESVAEGLGRIQRDLMVVRASRDGIVPDDAVQSVVPAWGDRARVQELVVGQGDDWYAHADLFVGHESPERVFAPVATFLARD